MVVSDRYFADLEEPQTTKTNNLFIFMPFFYMSIRFFIFFKKKKMRGVKQYAITSLYCIKEFEKHTRKHACYNLHQIDAAI